MTTLEVVITGDARRPFDEVALVRRADLDALVVTVAALLGDPSNQVLVAEPGADADHEDW